MCARSGLMSPQGYTTVYALASAIVFCAGFAYLTYVMENETIKAPVAPLPSTERLNNLYNVDRNVYAVTPDRNVYAYTLDNGTILTGRRLSAAFLPPETRTTFVDITKRKANFLEFTFVTGCDQKHFRESYDMVGSVQTVFPGSTLYYYSLGLDQAKVTQIKSWRNVIYREFNFSAYPPHISNLHSYGFKPLIVYEMLQEHDGVFWLDASVRMTRQNSSELWRDIYTVALASGGVVQFIVTVDGISYRDIYQCTHPHMFRYLPGDEDKMKQCDMVGSGMVLYHATPIIYQIVRYWALCGLTVECMSPAGASLQGCVTLHPGKHSCHRYDQSALNILLQNQLNYTNLQVGSRGQALLKIVRHPTDYYKLQIKKKKVPTATLR